MSSADRQTHRFGAGLWSTVGLCVAFGVAFAAIGIAHHDTGFAVTAAVVMVGYGIVLVGFARRSETVSLLGRHPLDERQSTLQSQALATTGGVLIVALVVATIWALAVRSSQAPTLTALCALAGITFIASTAWLSHKR
jgi:hypothetical protein